MNSKICVSSLSFLLLLLLNTLFFAIFISRSFLYPRSVRVSVYLTILILYSISSLSNSTKRVIVAKRCLSLLLCSSPLCLRPPPSVPPSRPVIPFVPVSVVSCAAPRASLRPWAPPHVRYAPRPASCRK